MSSHDKATRKPISIEEAELYCTADISVQPGFLHFVSKDGTCVSISKTGDKTVVEISYYSDIDQIEMVYDMDDTASGIAYETNGLSK